MSSDDRDPVDPVDSVEKMLDDAMRINWAQVLFFLLGFIAAAYTIERMTRASDIPSRSCLETHTCDSEDAARAAISEYCRGACTAVGLAWMGENADGCYCGGSGSVRHVAVPRGVTTDAP